jgi:hypothetical protein
MASPDTFETRGELTIGGPRVKGAEKTSITPEVADRFRHDRILHHVLGELLAPTSETS